MRQGARLRQSVRRQPEQDQRRKCCARHIAKTACNHGLLGHTLGEYVKGDAHTQTVESFFAILKRGVFGSFHSVSEQHLQRYVDEFAFRWNNRSSLGIEDTERAAELLKAIAGKRLTYRPTDERAEPRQADPPA